MSEGKVKRKIIFLIFAAVMVVAGGCGTDGGDTEASRDLFAMIHELCKKHRIHQK